MAYRCPAEPVDAHVAKGGNAEDTVKRRCLCNALTANAGHGQWRDGHEELPLVTSGDDLLSLPTFLRGARAYTAAHVIDYLGG